MCKNLEQDLAFMDLSLPETHWKRDETAQRWNSKDLNCQIFVDQQRIGTSQLCNSFYSPLCWEVKWNYLGGSSCRKWAKLGCVPGFLSWTEVTGFSWAWHKGDKIAPEAPAEASQGSWVPELGRTMTARGIKYLFMDPFSLILCACTPLRTWCLTTGGAAVVSDSES